MTTSSDELGELIKAEMKKVYSEVVVDHAINPRNMGSKDSPDSFARITGPCGDSMEIWLKFKEDTIIKANFNTDGCATTIAAGSVVTELAKGRNIGQALRTSHEDVLSALDGLPEGNKHCALLAANTLKAAVKDYLDLQKEPWKKVYKKY